MADSLALAVRSMFFCGRNVEKSTEGHFKEPVVVGQGAKVTNYIATLDNKIGQGTKTAVEALKTASKSDKLIEYAGKAVGLASTYINPLICVSSGVDVLMADDKQTALIQNGAGLGAMFGVEYLMKKHMDNIPKMKCMEGVTKKVMEFATKYKCEGKLPSIIHGVSFVVGSCGAYSLGNKFGTLVANKAKE